MPKGIYERVKTWAQTKTCVICGTEFKCPPSRQKTAQCCSTACGYKLQWGKKESRQCDHCGKRFQCPAPSQQKFCKPACRRAHRAAKDNATEIWIEKPCAVCGKAFKQPPSVAEKVKTCSKECGYALRKLRSSETRNCETCGGAFEHPHYKKKKYCSKACADEGKAEKAGQRRGWFPQANGSGYIIGRVNGKSILQHRYVMEQHIGRELLPFENVHHINGIRSDNRIENLEIWIKRQPPGQRLADTLKWAKAVLEAHGYSVVKNP